MSEDDLDPIFKALADPTRRRILDLLKGSAQTTGVLVDHFPNLSRFGVMKHMDVLREAGLIVVEKKGRKRLNHLNVVPIRQLHDRWVSGFRSLWTDVLIDVGQMAENPKEGGSGKSS